MRLNRQLQHEISYLVRRSPRANRLTPRSSARRVLRDTVGSRADLVTGLATRVARGTDPAHRRRETARRSAGPDRDFTDLHAWAEVYLPVQGGSDSIPRRVSSRRRALPWRPADRACGAGDRYTDVCEVDFSFACADARARGSAVTKPYSDAQWAAIRALGRQVTGSGEARRCLTQAASRRSCPSTT